MYSYRSVEIPVVTGDWVSAVCIYENRYSHLATLLSGQDVGGLWPTDFPWCVPDLWLTGDHFVGKLAAMD